MSAKSTLIAARDLIADEARWTQGCGARNSDGFPTDVESLSAVCWCIVGALDKVTGGDINAYGVARDALDARLPPYECVAGFNDTRTHAEVMALFDAAIAAQEETA